MCRIWDVHTVVANSLRTLPDAGIRRIGPQQGLYPKPSSWFRSDTCLPASSCMARRVKARQASGSKFALPLLLGVRRTLALIPGRAFLYHNTTSTIHRYLSSYAHCLMNWSFPPTISLGTVSRRFLVVLNARVELS